MAEERHLAMRTASRYVLRADGRAVEGPEHPLTAGTAIVGRVGEVDIVLDNPLVSRRHAEITVGPDGVSVRDLGSTNGTFVNGERVTEADLRAGDRLSFGGVTLILADPEFRVTRIAASAEGTIIVEAPTRREVIAPGGDGAAGERAPGESRDALDPERLFAAPVVSERALAERGLEIQVVPCAAIGGGMGSFVFVDLLRNAGVKGEDITVIGNEQKPHARYQRLCRNSQIPPHERLRSNSDSRPDNVWGFPGYAASEAWRDLRRGRIRSAAETWWSIFGESAIAQTYTPRSGVVFDALDRESERIGWSRMLRFGRARLVRKTEEGRLLVLASATDEHARRRYAVAAQFLHLAIGYPALQLLPDLAEYRERYQDRERVVNAYENHDHVYESLKKKGGTVMLRGRGIVASRILQRLWEERRTNKQIQVVHLHRSRLTEGHRYGSSRRRVEAEFEFQPFNWPKSCWTGEQRVTMERGSPEERKRLLEVWGGTTTANRRDWRAMVREGMRDGWYRPEYGVVKALRPGDDGRVITEISSSLAGGGRLELPADFVIDCTGLVAAPDRAPLLDDMIRTYSVPMNPYGRLDVTNDFEITGMRHMTSRMYASGAITLGGPHAAVDSFLGLQYAAYRAVHAMHGVSPREVPRLNGLHSLRQWLKWARGVAP
jgi:pSer/pThr/pTyr-binding forkhead associated (FHA) protein